MRGKAIMEFLKTENTIEEVVIVGRGDGKSTQSCEDTIDLIVKYQERARRAYEQGVR